MFLFINFLKVLPAAAAEAMGMYVPVAGLK